jgi:hypothetical protein
MTQTRTALIFGPKLEQIRAAVVPGSASYDAAEVAREMSSLQVKLWIYGFGNGVISLICLLNFFTELSA